MTRETVKRLSFIIIIIIIIIVWLGIIVAGVVAPAFEIVRLMIPGLKTYRAPIVVKM